MHGLFQGKYNFRLPALSNIREINSIFVDKALAKLLKNNFGERGDF